MSQHPDSPPRTPAPSARQPTVEAEFLRLCEIMRILRGPGGCPWDHEQTWTTLAPFVLEEACEVLDAIDRHDVDGVCEEIGDLIFEGVFLAQVASDEGHFTLRDALRTVSDKLVRRHPHVFEQDDEAHGPSREHVKTPGQVVAQWQEIKARERKTSGRERQSVLDAVPTSLPSLPRAEALGSRAAKVGFDWTSAESVLDKVEEELRELRAEQAPDRHSARTEEVGDLLFAVAQYARKAGIDADAALRAANRKFTSRFTALEDAVRDTNRAVNELSSIELNDIWDRVKAEG
ncbi:MAG: nucleoside triphosphate pyrophosphohydrolase, partial [Vicinamibacterales bacterium]